MARMSIANDAATPTTKSDVRSERRAASIEATAAKVTPPSNQRKSLPVEDDSRSPIDTPSAARSDRSIPTAPIAATADPIRRTGRRAGTFPPNASSPTTLAAKSIARPTYRQSLLATLAADGGGVVGTGMLGATTVPGATLMPKLNAPAVK